jgi:hypothetical protein
MNIDWARMAEPQADQYDTGVTLECCRQLPNAGPRRGLGDASTIFDGAVAIQPLEGPYSLMEGLSSAPADDQRIRTGADFVRQWPEVFEQFKALMHTFHPVIDPSGKRFRAGTRGSFSHSFESRLGSMCASVEDPVCLAQAFVHEMAHNKLRALGVSFESARRLITNDPQDLFASPIRIGVPRPMTAVFHAEYSFIYVTQLDLKLLAAGPDAELKSYLLELLERNVTRMEAGYKVIVDNIQVDAEGRLFVDGFLDWALRALTEGRSVLDAERAGPRA